MKKLIYFILVAAFVGLVAYSPRLFTPANTEVAYWTGGTGQDGSPNFYFIPTGVPNLHLGPNSAGGNVFQMGDSVNAAYCAATLNRHAGTGAYSGFIASNDLGHGADVVLTSSGNTSLGGGDIAEYLSNAQGGFWLYSQAAPITFKSVGGVIPVKVTTTQMNAISSPVDGQTIYNTTTHDYWVYENTTWTEQNTGGGGGTSVASGTYTPTVAGVTNAGTFTSTVAYYTQIGKITTVYIYGAFIPPSSGNTTISFTLPFTSSGNGGYGNGEILPNVDPSKGNVAEVDPHSTTVFYLKSYVSSSTNGTSTYACSFIYTAQ